VHETKSGFWIGLGGFWSIWKNVLKDKPKGLKIGMIGFKPPTREPQNKFYNVKIGLEVFFKNAKPHNIGNYHIWPMNHGLSLIKGRMVN